MAINVTDLVVARAVANPDHPALLHAGAALTYADLIQRAEAIATRLRPLLTGPSPRIALYCPNGADYVVLALGILRAGACLVPVASELAIPERQAQLTLTAPQLMLAAGPSHWLPFPGTDETVVNVNFTWCKLNQPAAFPEDRLAALNPAFIRFSSGTTGQSKGVVLSHETLIARVTSANRRLKLESKDRVLWTLPMAHHFAVSIMLYLIEGVTTVLEDSHLAHEVLNRARESGATVFYGSPFHLSLLAAEDSGRDWPTLRLGVSTAAALTVPTATAFLQRYGVPLTQGLGIIEAGLPLLNTEAARELPLSVGRPDDFAVKLCDESGLEVVRGEIGELWLRGPGMFDAYLSPWQEREVVTKDGWFATGDLASQDEEGRIFLRGRCKTAINFGGMKFFSEEVEAVLNTHPAVRESRVSGEPHERWGMIAVAEIVARDPSAPPTPLALGKHCREQLATYKIPARFSMVTEVPRTASGKIRR